MKKKRWFALVPALPAELLALGASAATVGTPAESVHPYEAIHF